MDSAGDRRRPISLRRPLGAALALSLAVGPLLVPAHAWADPGPTAPSMHGASDQPRDLPEPILTGPRAARPSLRAPGVFVIDADAAAGISNTGGEPSIAINPANPQQIAVSRFAFRWGTNSNADILYSTDGGISWTDERTIPAPPGVANTATAPRDQTFDYGRDGKLYGTFLTNGGQIVSGLTTDITKTSSWVWNTTTNNNVTTTQLTSGTRTNTDQPWLMVNRDPTTASQDDVYVGYQDFGSLPHDRVAVSYGANPVNFTADNPAGTGALQDGINGGLRMIPDPRNGTMYALYQQGGSNNVSQPQPVTIKLNRSTDGGATWTLNNSTDGITVDSVSSDQGNQGFKFGGVNALIGGVHHAAVDPTNGDVYVAYGQDASGTNQMKIRRLTANGTNNFTIGSAVNLPNAANSALPSVAVLSDGTVGVLYLTSDGNNASGFPKFSAHLARSTDHAATFTDTVVQQYTTNVGTANAPTERLFGDYQQLKAVGTTFYGSFIGNLNGVGQTTAQPVDTVFFSVPQFTESTLTSSANPSVYGQPVTFTATIAPKPDGGTVTFKVDGTQLGNPVAVDTTTGQATSDAIASLTVGDHTVTADYSGDDNFKPSTMSLKQTVGQAAVSTTLGSDGTPSAFGHSVTFTDTVCAAAPSTNPALPPSGTVTFRDGSTLLGTGTLAPGGGTNCSQAQVSFANLLPGSHTITALYNGDTNYLVGTLESITQVVACTTTFTGNVPHGVVVSSGSTCIINATVGGTVYGMSGSAVFISNSTINGGVVSTGGTLFGMCGSTAFSVQVSQASGFVVIGDPGDDGCAGNRISGTVVLSSNRGGAEIIGNRIGGGVQVNGTTGTGPFPEDTQAEIEGNTITGGLSCSGNTPPPTNGGNPNTVGGGRMGQCSAL